MSANHSGVKRLVLFDIDGILIKPKAMGYITKLIERHFGIAPFKSKVYGEGKTYRWILRERLKEAGIANPERDPRFAAALDDVTPIIESLKTTGFERVPYVEGLIKLLGRKGHTIGLLTGNTEKSAKIKLENVDLWHYFRIGAYGTDIYERSELVPLAIRDAERKTGIRFNRKDVYLVGDTVVDISCAKEGGVRVISVATGIETMQRLRSKKPDFLFRDFRNNARILSAIES